MSIKSIGIGLVLAAVTFVAGLANTQDLNAKRRLGLGKQLIEENCGDCMGASRQGLEKGIAEVRIAIEAGCEDQSGAYLLLADAYNTLAYVYARSDSQDQKDALRHRKQALEKLLELRPKDPRIRYQYAELLENRAQQIAALREIIESDRKDDVSRYSLGVLLVDTGHVEEGIGKLKEAVEIAGYERAQVYGRRLGAILIERGRNTEAAQVSRQIEQKKRKPH